MLLPLQLHRAPPSGARVLAEQLPLPPASETKVTRQWLLLGTLPLRVSLLLPLPLLQLPPPPLLLVLSVVLLVVVLVVVPALLAAQLLEARFPSQMWQSSQEEALLLQLPTLHRRLWGVLTGRRSRSSRRTPRFPQRCTLMLRCSTAPRLQLQQQLQQWPPPLLTRGSLMRISASRTWRCQLTWVTPWQEQQHPLAWRRAGRGMMLVE